MTPIQRFQKHSTNFNNLLISLTSKPTKNVVCFQVLSKIINIASRDSHNLKSMIASLVLGHISANEY